MLGCSEAAPQVVVLVFDFMDGLRQLSLLTFCEGGLWKLIDSKMYFRSQRKFIVFSIIVQRLSAVILITLLLM